MLTLKPMNTKKIIKLIAMSSIVTIVATVIIYIVAGNRQAISLLISAPFGIGALALSARHITRAVEENRLKVFLLHYVFRLACFSILLYVLLVVLHLGPLACALGLTLPVFVMMIMMLLDLNKPDRS
ncbi:hypothetical protein RsTz2092_04570 [Deferribacterales bacterium RsTz2092]|nr:hypothetical protein AGMMS49941_11450 [Deferribacterales bacterium]